MKIAGIVKTSLIDYPGLISCVLFAPGCNYDCFYCHNRALIGQPDTIIPFEQIIDFLKKRAGLIDGVVLSGGEPTLQPELYETIIKIRTLGYRIKLDTNGSSLEMVEALLRESLCDYFAVDYKAPRSRYSEICGPCANPDKALETIGLLWRCGAHFEVRTTVIPQLNLDDLTQMAKELPRLPRYVLNRYRKPEKFYFSDRLRVEAKPYTQAQLDDFAMALRLLQPNTESGTM